MPELNEPILEDDFPVHWDYVYVVDGKVTTSDIKGTVADLKRDLRLQGKEAKEVRRCDINGRLEIINK